MLCNDAEYKNMDQDESLGQLYDVQIRIKIFHKQTGWAYSFPTTLSIFSYVLGGGRENKDFFLVRLPGYLLFERHRRIF